MDSLLAFATQLAGQAGQLLLEYFSQAGFQTSIKADQTVVTEADLAADRLIAQAILEHFPTDVLLSEELQPTYLEGSSLPGAVWVIDPLDGTTNFSLGLHVWGVLITRLVDGWPDMAVLNFPLIGELYSVQRGRGALLNGSPIRVKPPDADRPTSFFSCCSRTFRSYHVRVPYKARILGSAAYSLCSVARGSSLLSFEATAKIWDIAGGWLLVEEAGGVIETLNGKQPFPLQPGLPYARQSYPTFAAATPELAAQARTQIVPK